MLFRHIIVLVNNRSFPHLRAIQSHGCYAANLCIIRTVAQKVRLSISDARYGYSDCFLISILYVRVDRDCLHHQRLNNETSLIWILVDILSVVRSGLVYFLPYESLAIRYDICFCFQKLA